MKKHSQPATRIKNDEFNVLLNRVRTKSIDREELLSCLPRITPKQIRSLLLDPTCPIKSSDAEPHIEKIWRNRPANQSDRIHNQALADVGLPMQRPDTDAAPHKRSRIPERGSVVYPSRLRPGLPGPVIIRHYNKQNLAEREESLPDRDHAPLEDYLPSWPLPYVKLGNFVLLDPPGKPAGAGYQEKLRHTLYHHIASTDVPEKEKQAWQIFIDESGDCMDYKKDARASTPSVGLAVMVPPGEILPPAPFGFHAVDMRTWGGATRKMRQAILERENVILVALQYETGAPPKGKHAPGIADFHGQIWRHLIMLCLELAAAATREDTDVYIYAEQVGPLSPENSSFTFAFLQDLLDRNAARAGWSRLHIKASLILPKNVHPGLGYPDAIGHVFRNTMGKATVLGEEIANRKNTFVFRHVQDDLENLHTLLTDIGKNPLQALRRLADTPHARISQFKKPILAAPVRNALKALPERDLNDLAQHLAYLVSQRPECYDTCAFIINMLPENRIGRIGFPPLRFVWNLNRLAVCNHHGDLEGAGRVCKSLERDLDSMPWDLRARYSTLRADVHNNALDFDAALATIETTYAEALQRRREDEKALHVIGCRAMTLALRGDSEEALGLVRENERLLFSFAGQERWLIYQAHILFDLGRYQEARQAIERIDSITGRTMLENAAGKYYRHALLKTQCQAPFMAPELLAQVCALPVDPSHPDIAILYWGIRAMRAEPDTALASLKLSPRLLERIAMAAASSSPVLRTIALAYYRQATADGFIDRQEDLDHAVSSIKGLRDTDNPLGILKFNYL